MHNPHTALALLSLTLLVFTCEFSSYAANESDSPDFSIIAKKTLDETLSELKKHYFKDDFSKFSEICNKERPNILKSRNSRELIYSINAMLHKLGISHISLLRPISRYEKRATAISKKIDKAPAPSNGDNKGKTDKSTVKKDPNYGKPADPGMRLCIADNHICVLDVEPSSAADNAGIKSGDIITAIHGFKFNPSQPSDLPWDFIAESMLKGTYSSKVPVTYITSNKTEKKINLPRTTVSDNWVRLGAMPKTTGKVKYEILKGNIGYIYITPCFPAQVIKMHRIITDELKNCNGLILDLRHNPGGMMTMAPGIAGWLTERKIDFGTMKTRNFPLHLSSDPQTTAFTGPLAIIINSGTFSTSEVLAAGLQDNKRAVVFGETSGGKCLPSVFLVLSTGYRLQTVLGDYTRSNGERIEKIGVTPDFPVKIKRADLLKGIDSQKEAARKYLITHNKPIDKKITKQN